MAMHSRLQFVSDSTARSIAARQPLRGPQAMQSLAQRGKVVGDGRQDGGRSSLAVGNGDDDGAFVDVGTDVADRGRMSHGPVLPVLARHCPPQASGVTHDDVSDWSNHSVYSNLVGTLFLAPGRGGDGDRCWTMTDD